MDRAIVSQFNILICTFIDNKISVEDCKEFLENLFMYDIDINKYNISDDDKVLINSIANNYINESLQFTEKQTNIIINNLVDIVYSSYYYFSISNNKNYSYADRQMAKNQHIIKDCLANTTYSYLVDDELGIKCKKEYINFKADFEKYTKYTNNIVDIYTTTPKDNKKIVKAIEQRIYVSSALLKKYGESSVINKYSLMSVVEDDVLEKVRAKRNNEVKSKFAA